MRVNNQHAYVLHHYSYRETSLVLELFTRTHGRLGVLAKGARRGAVRQRSSLEPFQPLLASWGGRGDLPVLSSVEVAGNAILLRGDRLYCGLYMNEVLLRLLHRHDAHEHLFDAYCLSLKNLAAGASLEATLRVFEKHLLQEVGYGLVLDHEINDDAPIDPAATYDYIPDRGPVRISDADANARGVRLHGSSLLALAGEVLTEAQALQETKTLMRTVLGQRLAGKPLNTRKLFHDLKQAPLGAE
ncbi:MAG: DNA repair protein RecO [Acidiferrobacterales bacterium]